MREQIYREEGLDPPEDLSYIGLISKHPKTCGPSCTLYTSITETGGLCAETGIVLKGQNCRKLEDCL